MKMDKASHDVRQYNGPWIETLYSRFMQMIAYLTIHDPTIHIIMESSYIKGKSHAHTNIMLVYRFKESSVDVIIWVIEQ